MSNLALIIYCGLITFFTRFSMIALLKKEMFNNRIREVLSYVPSAIFPAIIFPAVLIDNAGSLEFESNSKILASIVAIIIGYLSKNIIATILSGLILNLSALWRMYLTARCASSMGSGNLNRGVARWLILKTVYPSLINC